jgi:hypothetical protein
MQDHAGSVTVTGQVTPGTDGSEVDSVMVNNVAATIAADGTFTAAIEIQPGATLIHTEAKAKNGGKATDTRAIEAGELRKPGANIDNAITVAMSKDAFAKISDTASALVQVADFPTLLAPLQPMVHVGDQNGEDCQFARLYVDNLTMTGATISLSPVNGGLAFSAELDGLDVPGHMRYAVACIHDQNNVETRADTVTVSGTLLITPNGMNGFTNKLTNTNISVSGLNISASGIPGLILDLLPLDSAIQQIVPMAAEQFMQPMLDQALGALTAPKKLMFGGQTIDIQITPSTLNFTDTEGDVALNTSILIEGAENSSGFIFTDNGTPTMDPGNGLQLGLADDLANEMMSQATALGMIDITQPAQGGTFDALNLKPTLPPMISADPTNGNMRVVLPDMTATFMLAGQPVGKAALNVELEVQVMPSNNGQGVAVQLGQPVIYLDMLDDVANKTGLAPDDMQKAIQLGLGGQISSLSGLLSSIPLPQVAGLKMSNVSVASETGYVMVKATLE